MTIEVGIRFAGDSKQLVREVRALDAAADSLSASMLRARSSAEQLNGQSAALAGGGSKLASQYSGINDALRENTVVAQQSSGQVQKLLDRYDAAGARLRKMRADFEALSRAAMDGGVGEEDESRYESVMKTLERGMSGVAEKADTASRASAGVAREIVTIGREAMSGNWSRLPGSVSILAQRMGLLGGLLNPVALGLAAAGAAAGAAAIAFNQGEAEAAKINNALIVTGNYAGTTAGQMRALAEDISASGDITIGTAKDIVSALVSSGQIGGQALGQVAGLAAKYAAATGEEADKVGDKLVQIFSHPAKGAEELNEKMHLLSQSEIEHIRNLEAMGQAGEAQAELAAKLGERLDGVTVNAGYLSRAWQEVKNWAGSAWDAMMGWGRADDPSTKLTEKLADMEKKLRDLQDAGGPGWVKHVLGGDAAWTEYNYRIETLNQGIAATKKELADMQGSAAGAGAAAAAQEQHSRVMAEAQRLSESYQREQLQIQIESERAELERNAAVLAGTVDEAKRRDLLKEQNILQNAIAANQKKIDDLGKTRAKADPNQATLDGMDSSLQQKQWAAAGASAEQIKVYSLAVKGATQSQLEHAQAVADSIGEIDRQTAARKLDQQAMQEAQKDYDAMVAKIAEHARGLDDDTAKLADQTYALQYGKDALAALQKARDLDTAAIKRRRLASIDATNQTTAESAALREEIAALERHSAAVEANDAAQRSKAEIDAQAKQWKEIEGVANKTFISIFDSGKSAFDRLRDTLKNGLYQLLYQMTVRRWLIDITAAVSGQAVAGQLAASMGQSYVATGANLLSAGGLVSNGVGYAASLLGGSSVYGEGFMTGMSLSASEAQTAASLYSAAAAEGGANAASYQAAASGLTSGSSASSALGTVGTYAGYAALAVAAYKLGNWIGGLISNRGGTPGLDLGRVAVGYDGSGAATGTAVKAEGPGTLAYRAQAAQFEAQYVQLARNFGFTAADANWELWGNMGKNRQDPHFGMAVSVGSSSYRSAEEVQITDANMQREAARVIMAALQGSDLPKYLSGIFDRIDVSTASADDINNALSFAGALKSIRDQLSGASTAEQQQRMQVEQMAGALGTTFDTYRQDYLAAIDAGRVATQAQLDAWQNLGAAIDQVTQATDAAAQAEQQLAADRQSQLDNLLAQQRQYAQAILDERDGLQDQLDKLEGNTAAIRERELAAIDPLNRALYLQVQALQDAADASGRYNQALQQLIGAGGNIEQLVRQIRSGGIGGGAPTQDTLASLRGAYLSDLSAAKIGDVDASNRVAQSAQAYLQAAQTLAPSLANYNATAAQVAAELDALPATESYQQQQLDALNAIRDGTDAMSRALADLDASLVAALAAGFSSIDLNTDGLLSFDELKTALGGVATDAQLRQLIAVTDSNGDGQISRLEALGASIGDMTGAIVGQLAGGFAALDSNTDGLLNFDELKAGLGTVATDAQLRALIALTDSNGDGQISSLEAINADTGSVDTNTNDTITELRRLVGETISNSGHLMEVNVSIGSLTAAISAATAQQKIEAAQQQIQALLAQQAGLEQSVQAGIAGIWSLAQKYGVTLQATVGENSKDNTATFGIDADGLFYGNYNQITGETENMVAFRDAFWLPGGVWDQTYGMAAQLAALAGKIDTARQAVIDLGGVPQFASGGFHAGGWRVVGERGPELEYTGPSRIFSNGQSGQLLDLTPLIREMRQLRDSADQQRALLTRIMSDTGATATALRKAGGGGPLLVELVAP